MEKLFYFILSIVVSICSVSIPVFADEISDTDSAYTLPTDKNTDVDSATDVKDSNDTTDSSDKYTDGGSTNTKDSSVNNENGNTYTNGDNSTGGTLSNGSENKTDLSAEDKQTSDSVHLEFKMIPRMQVKDSTAEFYLYDSEGNLLSKVSEWVGGITEKLSFDISVPRYRLGKSFTLKLNSGLTYIKYYDRVYGVGEDIKLDTYIYTSDTGEDVIGNSFAFDACPEYEHLIILYIDGKQQNPTPRARLIDDTAMIPLKATAEALGFDVRYDERYRSVVCSIGDEQALFNLDLSYATVFGTDIYLSKPCITIDGTAFVPARSFAEAVGSSIEAIDFGDHIDVCIGSSTRVSDYMKKIPVNQWGLSSRTSYLVWIDKSDYRVRVYTGSQYKWKLEKTFACAIGAPNSPTITGSFEYQYRMPGWYYDGYYVGPCLVFYGNYAMHSTLLRYDNTPYDNRVGVMISHGCVRLRKSDIDWLDSYLPIGSRIYITE